ncbi:hypothetical protein [Vibrio sonorensis]|uniref:hypothetical protein n=1 Tax=Vibrio sonorensis TaxID=1004316 RepID=UPI0008D9CCBE|nr:hypothetical protein [Vibrio sonorensis]
MQFKIADKLTRNSYMGAIFILLFWPTVVFCGSWLMYGKVGWETLTYTIAASTVFAFLNYRGRKAFLHYANHHYIEVTEKGLITYEPDSYEVLNWANVKSIKVKRSKGAIKSIKLTGTNGLQADLSRYQNLDSLYAEMQKFIGERPSN